MAKKGLLLLNLGSPQAPTPEAVGVYLKQFLNDPYVIDIPKILRYILVNFLIVPRRKYASSEAYEKIWTAKGSPLVQTTKEFAEQVAVALIDQFEVRWAMRYGSPSVASVVKGWEIDELFVVPLYPQYAESSTRTAVEDVAKSFDKPFSYLRDFFIEPEFIDSEVLQIEAALKDFSADHLLLSFHGLPEHHLSKLHPDHCGKAADCSKVVTAKNRLCYRAQSFATFSAISSRLSFDKNKMSLGFQSRLGNKPWIKPYTDIVVDELAQKGVRKLLVACPSFVADCLETLEEIQMRLKEQFIASGGQDLRLVAAPNSEAHWIKNFSSMIRNSSAAWTTYRK